jgi:SSS family solute:Na+ symporter
MLGGNKGSYIDRCHPGIILITGAIVCAQILTFSMPEGPGSFFRIAAANNKFSLGSLGTSLSESTFWVVLIYGLFINLQNYVN